MVTLTNMPNYDIDYVVTLEMTVCITADSQNEAQQLWEEDAYPAEEARELDSYVEKMVGITRRNDDKKASIV